MRIFKDRIRNFRGKPVYEILTKTKESKDSFFVCYRETMDGKKTCRNMDYTYMGGYWTNGKPEKNWIPFWGKKTPRIFALEPHRATVEDIQPLLDNNHDFYYTFAKYGAMSRMEAFNLFKTWSKYPKLEILLNMGFISLATNRNFLKLNMKKQKEIVNFFIGNEDRTDQDMPSRRHATMDEIKGAMKYNCTYEQFKEYRSDTKTHYIKGLDYHAYRKLKNKGIPLYDYMWYRGMLKRDFPERLEDEYWNTFKSAEDFFEKERRCNEQIENRRNLENAERALKKARQYRSTTAKYKSWDGEFNGLHVYIPRSIQDVREQAIKLNQCLIDCDYVSEVIKKHCILAFIKKDEEPLATAELEIRNKEFKLGQFYGNELDRDNCLPPEECKEALEMFMDKFIRKSA